MSHEEEDTCVSYEEEDTCEVNASGGMHVESAPVLRVVSLVPNPLPILSVFNYV